MKWNKLIMIKSKNKIILNNNVLHFVWKKWLKKMIEKRIVKKKEKWGRKNNNNTMLNKMLKIRIDSFCLPIFDAFFQMRKNERREYRNHK